MQIEAWIYWLILDYKSCIGNRDKESSWISGRGPEWVAQERFNCLRISEVSVLVVGAKAGRSWQKGAVEQTCSLHSSQETEEEH